VWPTTSRECPIERRPLVAQLADRWRWPRRRARLPGRGRIVELAADPVSWLKRGRPGRIGRIGRIGADERLIGMLMIRDEDDVIADTLAAAVRWFDRIYVLDGTTDAERVARTDEILAGRPEVLWHARDADWFPDGVTDGSRQVLLDRIRAEHGVDNWIGLLHADEFLDQDPRPMLAARHPSLHPSLRVRVVHTFLHIDDADRWNGSEAVSLRTCVAHQMWPGVPESRFFFDDGSRDFEVDRHSKVLPRSHRAGELVDGYVITQYNERSPEQLLARARQRVDSDWQVGHYARLLTENPDIFVASLDTPDAPFAPEFAGDPVGPFRVVDGATVPHGPALHVAEPAIETELTDLERLRSLRSEGRTRRDLMPIVEPGGILDVLDRGSRRAHRRAVKALGRPGAFGHGDPIPDARSLVRHTTRIVGSRRISSAQRRVAISEFVVRMCNAGAGEAGWYTVIPANRRPALVSFLRPAPTATDELDDFCADRRAGTVRSSMFGGEHDTEAATLPSDVDAMRRGIRRGESVDGGAELRAFEVGEKIDVDGLGTLEITTFTQRNWSRVGVASLGDTRYFVKQFIDRVGGRHDKGYDGDRATQEMLGEKVGTTLRVVPVVGRVQDRLIIVSPLIAMHTIDSIGRARAKHREPAAKVGSALAEILDERRVDGGRVSVWKGLDPKNVGWTDDGDLWLFDFGPPAELDVEEAAARVMAAGLLSRWVARPGLHLVWPERCILRGVSEPVAKFTDYERVHAELRQHAELRLREPQRVGIAATATRLGLRTLGRVHWWAVEREARRLFATT
jgi:hypothetical protein